MYLFSFLKHFIFAAFSMTVDKSGATYHWDRYRIYLRFDAFANLEMRRSTKQFMNLSFNIIQHKNLPHLRYSIAIHKCVSGYDYQMQ